MLVAYIEKVFPRISNYLEVKGEFIIASSFL
jgi:hypothetical protein